jgi:hypothetical protein
LYSFTVWRTSLWEVENMLQGVWKLLDMDFK